MQNIPPKIAKDIIRYTLPLLLTMSSRGENQNDRYWGTIPGSLVASVLAMYISYCGSKIRLVLSSVLYLASLFVPSLYFFSLGFILNQSYNTNIFRSQQPSVSKLVSKIELVGLLASEAVTIPQNVKIVLGGATLISSVLARSPCVETEEPFECMKGRIDSANALNSEYRFFLKKGSGHDGGGRRLYIVDALYMITRRKMDLLFSILFSLELSEFFIFLVGVLFVLDVPWELACLLLKTEPTPNVSLRLISNYAIYLTIDFVCKKSKIQG